MATKLDTVGIRVPPKVRALLQAQADSQYRSLSNWCAAILQGHCEASQKAKPKQVNGHDHKAAKTASP